MYINLHLIARFIRFGESCGFINIDNYDIMIEGEYENYQEYLKYQEYKENGIFNDPSFLALPYIEDSVYRELRNEFLEKYYPRKGWYFRKLNDRDFEQYFHITVEESTLSDDWYEYEDEFRIKLLQEWCDKNNLLYTLKNES